MRPKLVANSRITIKYYIVVSDGVHIQFVSLMHIKHNGMSSTKITTVQCYCYT